MPKLKKPAPKTVNPPAPVAAARTVAAPILVAHPPAKNPSLLGVSILLFALWFVFLLVAAFWG
ncbi:MAG: hypothetical protein SFU86_20745 [Pirellulaceae bacterium]|nr:hypothetical protein [Pirellulaceae bacterium]